MSCPRALIRLMPLLGLGALPGVSSAHGQEVEAGWEGDRSQGYAYVDPTLAVVIAEGHAIVMGLSLNYLYYQFPDSGGPTRLFSPGIDFLIGHRWLGERASYTVAVGYEARHTSWYPSVEAASVSREHGPTAEADVWLQPAPRTTVLALISYSTANHYVWSRIGVKRQVTGHTTPPAVALALGADGTVQGNRDERSYQAGALVALEFPRSGAALELRAGVARLVYSDRTTETRPRWGLGFYRDF